MAKPPPNLSTTAESQAADCAWPCWILNPQAGTTIIMLHGFRGSHRGLMALARSLHGYRLVVPDLPGMGQAPPLTHDGLNDYADWLESLRQDLDISNFILLGHSLGALIALKYSLRYPDKAHRMVLVSPVPHASTFHYVASLYYLIGLALPAPLAKPWFGAKIIQHPVRRLTMRTNDPAVRRWLQQDGLRELRELQPATHISNFLAALTARPRQWLSSTAIPTLIVTGDQDIITPVSRIRRSYDGHPHVNLCVIPGMGHFGFYESTDLIADQIRHWLTSKPPV